MQEALYLFKKIYRPCLAKTTHKTSLMKQNIDVCAKYITSIVNRSLSSGCFPDSQKIAHVKPLLKKPNLDKEVFKNYRPVANLKYLGKTIERVVSSRISDHVQSAYKLFHGMETALLRVNNYIFICHGWWKYHCISFVRLKRRFWHSRSQNPSLPPSVSSWNTWHSPGLV